MGSAYKAIRDRNKDDSSGYDLKSRRPDVRGNEYKSSFEKDAVKRRERSFEEWRDKNT